jgi:hypothetical protein
MVGAEACREVSRGALVGGAGSGGTMAMCGACRAREACARAAGAYGARVEWACGRMGQDGAGWDGLLAPAA